MLAAIQSQRWLGYGCDRVTDEAGVAGAAGGARPDGGAAGADPAGGEPGAGSWSNAALALRADPGRGAGPLWGRDGPWRQARPARSPARQPALQAQDTT